MRTRHRLGAVLLLLGLVLGMGLAGRSMGQPAAARQQPAPPPSAPGLPQGTARLSDDLRADDFPSIAVDPEGIAWCAWQSYSGRQDEIRLRKHTAGRWHTFTRVPGISGDVWRPQVAVDANHTVWIVWAQQVSGNWDLYARGLAGDRWSALTRLTTDPLPDLNHHLVPDGVGNLVVVWQAFRGSPRPNSEVYLKHFDHLTGRWSSETRVSSSAANDWDPAVAVDGQRNAWVVWDTYASGNYDVALRSLPLPGGTTAPGQLLSVASTPEAEMRATVACDRADRVWVAFEAARPNWGKDQGYTIRQNPVGVPLGGPRRVAVRVLERGQWREPAADFVDAMPEGERAFFYTPHLLADDAGRVWLNVRHRSTQSIRGAQGRVQQRNLWREWLTRYDGDRWAPAAEMANSAGRQSSLADIAAGRDGTVWLAWNSDNRLTSNPHQPVHDEVYAARVPAAGAPREPQLKNLVADERGKGREGERGSSDRTSLSPFPPLSLSTSLRSRQPAPPLGAHRDEPGDLRAIRAYRAKIGTTAHQIVRGDLHRHTELSWDGGGGGDGSVLDFYRYMIDAASMDYGAITDHNAGGDYEYWWWYTEKLADLFHVPGAYVPLFAYERSALYPNGHRNIVHSYRGVSVVSFFTTPELTGPRPGVGTGALLENDTKLLYGEIRKTNGIAISHTSATRMGTDWRDNDKQLEPVVEIFQGARTNYEYAGAPKSADPQRDSGHVQQAGYEPEGFVWNAWKKGYRLGVITSSDHGSTHMSYAMVYSPKPTREAILDAIRKRHTYGATDNILLEFRIGSGFMGDEITVTGAPTLWVKIRGTNELGRVDLIKNDTFLYNTDPKGQTAQLTFRDLKAAKGTAYYYVRVQQADGQIAWSSPIWVTIR